ATAVLAPMLFRRVLQRAPNMLLRFITWHDDVVGDIERGRVDLMFSGAPVDTALRSELLFEDRFVCVVDRNHPVSGDRMSMTDFMTHPHVIIDVHSGLQTGIDD